MSRIVKQGDWGSVLLDYLTHGLIDSWTMKGGRLLTWLRNYPRALVLDVVVAAVCAAGALVGARHLRVWHHLRAARQALDRRDFEQAQAHLDCCLADRPNDGELHFLAGQTARRRGDFDLAEQHLHFCGRLRWSPERVALEWALLRAQQGDLEAVAIP